MRWFFSIRKARGLKQQLLCSQPYHYHGGSGSGSGSAVLHSPNSPTRFKSIRSLVNIGNLQSSSSFFCCSYATTSASRDSTDLQSRLNVLEENGNTTKKMEVQIISGESIKPASPTPDHLKTFSLSIIDQFFLNCYVPLVLFFPNTNHASLADITKRSKHLKDSLSELLTRYYPFAGEIKDDLQIECNDKGVYFIEARVNQTLNDFLYQPDDQKVRELIPEHPSETESSSANYIVSAQFNIFNCGGIALSVKVSHKIIDADTIFTFMNAWADSARGLPEKITPSFTASEIFPNNPSLKYSLPSKMMTSKPVTTKRFTFDSTALSSLKHQLIATTNTSSSLLEPPSRGPTRTEAIAGLIWKATAKAASTVRPFSSQSPHALLSIVNIRRRALPRLSRTTVGNLFISAVGICLPDSQPDLPTLIGQIRESIAKINPELLEALKGENGHQMVDWLLKSMHDLYDVIDEGDLLVVSSVLNNGIYQIDFGWGEPIWFYIVNPGFSRLLLLNDMMKGGGVEATVTLSPEEMKIFERDPEILSYASMDVSPLQFLN